MIIGSKLGFMSGSDEPATVDFIRTKVNSTNQTSIVDSNVPIGDADPNRWVVYVGHAGSNSSNATNWNCTIQGITATKLLFRNGVTNAYGGAGLFIANVPTGTTATCSITISGNMQYSGGASYVINNLKSGVPVDSFISTAENTGTLSGNLNVSKGGIIIGDAGGWTNTTTSSAWSGSAGLVEQYDQVTSGSNDLRQSGALQAFEADAAGLAVINTMSANYLNNAPGDLMAISMR